MFRFLGKNNLARITFGALFLGVSTRMLYSHLALYLKFELHASPSQVAFVDGCVEFFAYLVRVLFGLVSDYFHNRKVWMLSGCALVLLVKPFFMFLSSIGDVLVAVMIDRFGSSMQVCPRDALTAECSAKNRYGAAFGFLKSMKTIGGMVGVLLAIGIMHLSGENYRILFICSAIPALLSLLAVSAIECGSDGATELRSRRWADGVRSFGQRISVFLKSLRCLDRTFFFLMIAAGVCRMGFFGESLLALRASDFTSNTFAALTALFGGLGQAICSYPMGLWADKAPNKMLVVGTSLLISVFAHVLMMLCDNIYTLYAGILLSSGQQAVIQTLFLTIISHSVGDNLRATAIGIFYCAMGLAYLIGTGICGLLCEFGYSGAFLCCIAINCCGLLLCLWIGRRRRLEIV
jgi:predicted MFS family arabinose efflux permease